MTMLKNSTSVIECECGEDECLHPYKSGSQTCNMISYVLSVLIIIFKLKLFSNFSKSQGEMS